MLGEALSDLEIAGATNGDLLVLAIPRGGVVVGAEVARVLGASLDVWMARKIGAPGNPELAIGSVASHGELLLDRSLIKTLGVSDEFIQEAARRERAVLERRLAEFRGADAGPVRVEGRSVVLVDDGVATGSTALAALAALRRGGAARRILAVPVAPLDRMNALKNAAEELVVLEAAADFYAVGQFYEHFETVEDEEVVGLLSEFSR